MPDILDPLGGAGGADELLSDDSWLGAMVDVELALARALVEEGVAPDWMTAVIDELRVRPPLDSTAIAVAARSGGNPVIPLVKHLGVIADEVHAGASGHLHLGATSQDILDSAAMVIAARVISAVDDQLGVLIGALAGLAADHRSTPMAGRTLGQHASPITFGLVVAGWLDGIAGAREQLRGVGSRLPLQYGGSVGTRAILTEVVGLRMPSASSTGIVQAVMAGFARGLGLRPAAPWHANRLPIVELAAALAAVVGAIGSMAADINSLARTEIAEVSERLGAGDGGSSAMPHKRNPVTSVLLVSAARRSPGLAATLFEAQVTEDQRSTGAWHSEWQTLRELERLTIQASATAADLAARLDVDAARMRSNLDFTDGLIYSERVTAILAEGMGRAAAFQLVEEASRESVQTSRPLQVVVAGRLAGNHDAQLRSRALAAFDPGYGLDAAGSIIDQVLARAKETS